MVSKETDTAQQVKDGIVTLRERMMTMAVKPNDGMREYWREKKRKWRKANPGKDKQYEKRGNTGHNQRVEKK